jgi:hypothetical protein
MTDTPDLEHPAGPTVFLSYAHDDASHIAAVMNLASFLESQGIAVELDHWHDHRRQDWYAWMLHTIEHADFVLVVASPQYRAVGDGSGAGREHRGVQAETAILRDRLYEDRKTWMGRVLPVVLPGRSVDELPRFTQPHSGSHFVIDTIAADDEGVEKLLRVLTGQPKFARPPRGQVPALPRVTGAAHVRIRRVLDGLPHVDGRVTLTAGTTSAAMLAVLFLFGLSWLATLVTAAAGGVVLAAIRLIARNLGTQWKIVALTVTPLLAGVLVALPDSWNPALDTVAGDSPQARSADPTALHPYGRTTSRTTDPAATAPGRGHDPDAAGPGGRGGAAFGPSGSTDSSGRSPGGGAVPGDGTIEILEVGHAFAPGTDRLTVTIHNSRADPVLVTQVRIYLERPPGKGHGHGWGDDDGPPSWHFTVPEDMQPGDPADDGSRRTHGLITMSGSTFSTPLVGQGYTMGKGFRRLLTFRPQKFLAGSGTASIVIDVPTTMVLQQTSQAQPAGPMVEYEFEPQEGAIYTYFELQTPEDVSYACDYLRRHEDDPVCGTVDPLDEVALPN